MIGLGGGSDSWLAVCSLHHYVYAENDDHTITDDYSDGALGTICVTMTRMGRYNRSKVFVPRPFSEIGPVNEKSKKAGSHAVS